jgi:hypothetical protein
MNTAKLQGYEQARINLMAELTAWNNYDSDDIVFDMAMLKLDLDDNPLALFDSIERFQCLIPVILSRLQNDIHGLYSSAGTYDLVILLLDSTTKVLSTMRLYLDNPWEYYDGKDTDIYPWVPEKTMLNAIRSIRTALKQWRDPKIRFKRDMQWFFLDLWIISTYLLDFVERSRWPPESSPEEANKWNEKSWCMHFWYQLLQQSPLLRYVERYGLSQRSIKIGIKRERMSTARLLERNCDAYEREQLQQKLENLWDEKKPEDYLEIADMPMIYSEDDDNDNLTSEIDEASNKTEPWQASLPEISRWNTHETRDLFFEKYPVFKEFHEFVMKLLNAFDRNWKHYRLEAKCPWERPALDYYLAELLMHSSFAMITVMADDKRGKITRSDTSAPPPASNLLKGAYRFCSEILEKSAQAIEISESRAYRDFATEARQLAGKIMNPAYSGNA